MLSTDACWLSCDHTFKSVSNIRSVRSADNKWIQQYTGLFCILNADGKVLTWKMTKRLSFQHAENVLLALKERLDAQGQEVEEFSWTTVAHFAASFRVFLGRSSRFTLTFFMQLKVSEKVPKRHPFHAECMRELQMVFRDSSDQGVVRTKPTPSADIIRQQMKRFAAKWSAMEYDDKRILQPAAITEVNSLLTHIQRGCLSGILPGRGTNRNERLHRELNKHMRQSRYGVELAYALLTKVGGFWYNERINARIAKRTIRPITAYSYTGSTTEQFRLATKADSTHLHTRPSAAQAELDIKVYTMQEVLEHIDGLAVTTS